MAQFIQREAKIDNESLLFIDSSDRLSDTLYNAASYQDTSGLVKQQITHVGMKSYHFDNLIPNINDRNNVITFWSDVDAAEFSATIPNGNYTIAALMTAIQVALNAAGSAVTFTLAVVPVGSLGEYTVTGNNLFRFVSSSHIDRARPCSGLFITDSSILSQTVIARGLYSRYIDVLISNLKEGQVLSNTFSKTTKFNNFSHLQRIILHPQEDKAESTVTREIYSIHHTRIRPRNVVDLIIDLYDEFGDLVHAPVQNLGGDNYGIDYLKYLFTISLKSV